MDLPLHTGFSSYRCKGLIDSHVESIYPMARLALPRRGNEGIHQDLNSGHTCFQGLSALFIVFETELVFFLSSSYTVT